MRPDPGKGLEVHVDADFTGNYDHFDTGKPDTAKSRHGYLITYSSFGSVANCANWWVLYDISGLDPFSKGSEGPSRPPPAEVVTEAIKVESSRPEDEVESAVHGMKIINEIISVHQCVLAEEGLTNRLDQFHAFKAITDLDTRYYHQAMGRLAQINSQMR